jgi:hypothetical protein
MMKKGNHPLKMYGKSPLKYTDPSTNGSYRNPKSIDNRNPYIGNTAGSSTDGENKPSSEKIVKKSEDQKIPGVDRPYTFKDYIGGGQNLSKTGPFSRLKAKLENKQEERQAKNLSKYKAEKGEQLNKVTDTGVEVDKKDYTLPEMPVERPEIPEIDESSIDLSAFNQVSDGYNRAMMRSKLYQMSNATDLQQIQQAVQPQDQMGMQDQIGMQPDPNDIYNVSGRNNDMLTNAAFKMFGSKKHRNQ